jgi:hypothetical protein
MNKLASIYYLQSLGLPTQDNLFIYQKGKEKSLENTCLKIGGGWCIRCAKRPAMHENMEIKLPWKISPAETIISGIEEIKKEVRGEYEVFIHPQRDMPKGGNLLVTGGEIIIESVKGNYMDVSRLSRGTRNPDEIIRFKPGMLSFKKEGKENLSVQEIAQLRWAERSLDYVIANALIAPVAIEFSFDGPRMYLHDVIVGN